jgi:aspartate/glutamate racemase
VKDGPRRFRTLGLLGGMGPSATADVLAKIIEVTPAARDQDHIPVLARCVPQIPDRTEGATRRRCFSGERYRRGRARLAPWRGRLPRDRL